jgi:hypothetical protein
MIFILILDLPRFQLCAAPKAKWALHFLTFPRAYALGYLLSP